MSCPYLSALATVTQSKTQPSHATAVRLFSLHNKDHTSSTCKVVHLVRHAEGIHNVTENHKTPEFFDARLTPKGVDQCHTLAKHTTGLAVEAVLVSPTTRCLETARLSFPHIYGPKNDKNQCASDLDDCNGPSHVKSTSRENVPFIAYEEWRETLNYLSDSRRPRAALQRDYAHVNFEFVRHEDDPLWAHFESQFGDYSKHMQRRESGDPKSLYVRAHAAWKVLLSRPEKNLAVVSHSAFFKHMFTPLFPDLEGVVKYEDDDVRNFMTKGGFENCELRTVKVDIPESA